MRYFHKMILHCWKPLRLQGIYSAVICCETTLIANLSNKTNGPTKLKEKSNPIIEVYFTIEENLCKLFFPNYGRYPTKGGVFFFPRKSLWLTHTRIWKSCYNFFFSFPGKVHEPQFAHTIKKKIFYFRWIRWFKVLSSKKDFGMAFTLASQHFYYANLYLIVQEYLSLSITQISDLWYYFPNIYNK